MYVQHAPDLFTSRHRLRLGLISLTRQMTVVRLPGGRLWVHSPNPLDDSLRRATADLGTVTWLVAPNLFHHRALAQWKSAWPGALIGAPGLADKRRDLAFDAELGAEPPEEWGGAFEQLVTEGTPKLNEVVFFHRASGTLVLTDYCFNQGPDSGLPWLSRVILKPLRAYGRFGPSRMFRFLVQDADAVRRSIRSMVERWPIERLVMSHGEVVAEDAARRLREAHGA